jgi:hypothetical protein
MGLAMRMIGLAALAVVLLGNAPTGALAAQEASDGSTVVATAVTNLLQDLRRNDGVPEGTFRFDARLLERREFVRPGAAPTPYYALGARTSLTGAAALAAAGAHSGDMESARVCANDSLRSCTLGNAVAVFAASEPWVARDSAQVIVKALWMADLVKQPVQEGVFRLTLQRNPGGWRVVRTETLMIS